MTRLLQLYLRNSKDYLAITEQQIFGLVGGAPHHFAHEGDQNRDHHILFRTYLYWASFVRWRGFIFC